MLTTVAIPFYNNQDTLEPAIRSVFAQTHPNWELILLDDGSTDRSLSIARRAEGQSVRVISDGLHRGLVYRLNQAAVLAQGSLLARMDARDMMHPDRLIVQANYLEAYPRVDVVGGAAIMVDSQGLPFALRDPAEHAVRGSRPVTPFIHSTVVGRTAWFRANPYAEGYPGAEDLELWYRTHRTAVSVNLPQPLLFHRERPKFSWRDYKQGERSSSRVLTIHGPGAIGLPRAIAAIAASRVRCGAVACAAAFGAAGLLLHARDHELGVAELRDAHRALATIMRTSPAGRPYLRGRRTRSA